MVESRDPTPVVTVGIDLTTLLADTATVPPEAARVPVSGIAYRSDRVRRGDVFFCIPGFEHDGHDFAADAVARGAAAVVVKRPLPALGAPQVLTDDPRRALALAADVFFGRPSDSLRVAGITGTNGKTTSTYLLDAVLRTSGMCTGLVGTVETRVAGERRPAARTTPESSDLQALFAEMVAAGVQAASVEVSSHAIDLHRVDGVRFAVAAFTNLTQDHLDYHATLEEYFAVKRRLFTEMDVAARVIDVDDEHGAGLAAALGDVLTVGRSRRAAVRAEGLDLGPMGSRFTLVTPDGRVDVSLPLAAAFNVDNALVAAGCALSLGVPLDTIAEGLSRAPQVPGRLEAVDGGQPFPVLVDYAHTPDGLEKAIGAVKGVTGGRVIVVFGCGGDRDPAKRPLMGEVAATTADIVVATTDNPRTEDPVGILLNVEDGLKRGRAPYEIIVDRRAAIRRAVQLAREGDAVLIAGKGHEDYQEGADGRVHFDDREVALEELVRRC